MMKFILGSEYEYYEMSINITSLLFFRISKSMLTSLISVGFIFIFYTYIASYTLEHAHDFRMICYLVFHQRNTFHKQIEKKKNERNKKKSSISVHSFHHLKSVSITNLMHLRIYASKKAKKKKKEVEMK